MIFLTIGTDLPFNRLIKAVDKWAVENSQVDIIAQVGAVGDDDYKPKNMTAKSMLTPTEYNKYCADADFLIAHAGMGSIITALTIRKPIVLVPRLAKFGEHRNDHQLATAEKFMSRNGIFVAPTIDDLNDTIEAAQKFVIEQEMGEFEIFAPKEFTDKLSAFICEA